LIVSKEGFQVAYEAFSGNKFEVHTIIPVVKDFIETNKAGTFTVVADAAMFSAESVKAKPTNIINEFISKLFALH
jgi:transposase